MSIGITDPKEKYFKNGTWVWVGSEWLETPGDADGAMSVSIHSQDINVEIEQTNPANLTPGLMGWINGAWQKNPLLWGYSGVVAETLSDTNLAAGGKALNGTRVPTGEIWIILNAAIWYLGTAPSRLSIHVGDVYGFFTILQENSPVSSYRYIYNGMIVLSPGEYLQGTVEGATAGDDLHFRYRGYKMDIDQ